MNDQDNRLLHQVIDDNKAMREAGLKLAEASLHVIREYDGLHRLSLAVAEWSKVVAAEGGRGRMHADEQADSLVKGL